MPDKTIAKELQEQIDKLDAPNIVVVGRTGVGKSSLINAVFGLDMAEVGAGLPVTKAFCRYPDEGDDKHMHIPIVLYDSAGYEAGKESEFVNNVVSFIEEKQNLGIEKQIHLVWYVINASSARVELFEKHIIDTINSQGIPAVIILSQCDRATVEEIDGIKKAIEKFGLNQVYDVIEVSAFPLVVNGKPICEKFGLDLLVNKTIDLLPELYVNSMITAQVVDLRAKRKVVWQYISAAAAISFSSAALPIPAGGTAGLILSQTALCTAIASVYGYKEVGQFLSGIGTVNAFTTILNTAIGDLVTMVVPILGPAAAVIPASYIVAFGLTCNAVFEKIATENISGTKEEMKSYLKITFKKEFEKRSLLQIKSEEDLKIIERGFLDTL